MIYQCAFANVLCMPVTNWWLQPCVRSDGIQLLVAYIVEVCRLVCSVCKYTKWSCLRLDRKCIVQPVLGGVSPQGIG